MMFKVAYKRSQPAAHQRLSSTLDQPLFMPPPRQTGSIIHLKDHQSILWTFPCWDCSSSIQHRALLLQERAMRFDFPRQGHHCFACVYLCKTSRLGSPLLLIAYQLAGLRPYTTMLLSRQYPFSTILLTPLTARRICLH